MHLLSQASVRIWPKNWSAGWTRSIGACLQRCKFVDPTHVCVARQIIRGSESPLAGTVGNVNMGNESIILLPPQGTRENTYMYSDGNNGGNCSRCRPRLWVFKPLSGTLDHERDGTL